MRETVVFRWLAAGDTGDFEAFDELLHPNVIVHAPLGLSTKSAEAEKEVWRKALHAIPTIQHDVQEVVVNDNIEMARVLVRGVIESDFANIKGSGKSFVIDQAIILHLKEGKAIEIWEITDVAS